MQSRDCVAHSQNPKIEPAMCTIWRLHKVPVRYRPNAASGGWRYGHDLMS